MSPIVALILFVALVKVLLRIERGRNPEATSALWVPTFFLILCASKPIARWLEPNSLVLSTGNYEAGSPVDRIVLIILIILSLIILNKRRIEWYRVLDDNFWLILLYLYLGLSILWSDFPFVSFKRWIRLLGAIPIAAVILTERSPFKALESVLRRCAYVMIPISFLLIKYYPHLGVQYVTWSGTKMWVGVASQKNGLGMICVLSVLLIVWTFLREWRSRNLLKSRSRVFADGFILSVSFLLLQGFRGVYSATAIGIIIVAIVSLLLLYRMKNSVRFTATFLLCATAVVLLALPVVDSLISTVTSAFNRNESFTGRTDIWSAVLDVASRNALLGVGYGGYWGLQDDEIYSVVGVKEAHSGYLDVYLEVGLVGIVLLLAFLLAYYRKVLRELNYAYDWSLFGICFLIMSLIQNYTESHFIRTSSFFWNILIFLMIVLSSSSLQKNRNRLCQDEYLMLNKQK